MRILHVVQTLEPKADGVASFVSEMIARQREIGHEVEYLTGDGAPGRQLVGLTAEHGDLGRRCWSALRRFEVVHLHAMWVRSTYVGGQIAILRKVPFVVSPHGMLDPWALGRSRMAKRVARAAGFDRILSRAGCIHALCEAERSAIWRLGFRTPVTVVPPGIDPDVLHGQKRSPRKTILLVGRIHPKKGLDLLAHAFSSLSRRFPDWKLVIAGPDHVGLTPSLRSRLSMVDARRVEFPGQVMGTGEAAPPCRGRCVRLAKPQRRAPYRRPRGHGCRNPRGDHEGVQSTRGCPREGGSRVRALRHIDRLVTGVRAGGN